MNAAPDPRPAHAESDTYLALVCSRLSDDLSGVARYDVEWRRAGQNMGCLQCRRCRVPMPFCPVTSSGTVIEA